MAVALGLALSLALGCSRANSPPAVVVYASQDQEYAEPILRQFTRETGIAVKAVYDSEAVKTVGLAQRLLAEKARPRCDLFWNNEELRTRQLAAADLFAEPNGWERLGYRTRQLVVNRNAVRSGSGSAIPSSLSDLTNSAWKGRVALAYPLFGTTATHFLALEQKWGEERWRRWLTGLQQNAPLLVDGNSVVVKLVGQGEAWVGLTDSDDLAAGLREGFPIQGREPDDGPFQIHNTIAILRAAPHPAEARKLRDFLRRPDIIDQLIRAHALVGAGTPAGGEAAPLPDWKEILAHLEERTGVLREMFLR